MIRRLAWLMLPLLLCLPAAAQSSSVVEAVQIDYFQDVRFQEADLVGGCGSGAGDAGGGAFERSDDGRRIRFYERPPQEGAGVPLYEDGYGSTGCGSARFPVDVPAGTETVSVAYLGDRRVDALQGGVDAGAQIIQEVRLRFPDGNNASHEVFGPSEGSRDMATITIPAFTAHQAGPATLEWYFEDRGADYVGQGAPNPLSGQDFSARVEDAIVTFHARPVTEPAVSSHGTRDGTRLLTEHRVEVDAPSPGAAVAALRVDVAPELRLDHVVAPDGTELREVDTFSGQGILGRDQTDIVLLLEDGQASAIVPAPLVATHGGGTYRFVFIEERGLEASPLLAPTSYVLLLTPLPFAALAWFEARSFRREAFGGFARTARNLQRGVVLISAYYIAVVASAALAGRLALMAIWPMPLEGILLYVQVVLAVVAFSALWLVAREMYRIARPRGAQLADDRPNDA